MSDTEYSDEEDRVSLYARATFGKQVDLFFSSDIGRYLMLRAEGEAADALEEFKKCDPADMNRVRMLQTKIRMADNFKQWLESAVSDGLQAINLIEDRGLV